MTRHTTTLAQHLVWALEAAHCRDHATAWTAHETGYAAATSHHNAQAHLRATRAICQQCPVLAPWAERARLDRYTGLAVGTAYRNGRPQTSDGTP